MDSALGLDHQPSQISGGVGSVEESKTQAQAELDRIAESEDEDADMIDKIEGAQKVRLDAEKDDN